MTTNKLYESGKQYLYLQQFSIIPIFAMGHQVKKGPDNIDRLIFQIIRTVSNRFGSRKR